MKQIIKDVALKFDFADGAPELTLKLNQAPVDILKAELLKIRGLLDKGKKIDVELAEHKEKRSLSANAYMWVLLEKIAQKIKSDKDSVYNDMLIRYGVFTTVSVKKEAADEFVQIYESPTKILGTSLLNGAEFVHLRVCIGSSKYDTKQMSQLLEGIVSECKDLEIDTMTPAEIAQLISLMEKKA